MMTKSFFMTLLVSFMMTASANAATAAGNNEMATAADASSSATVSTTEWTSPLSTQTTGNSLLVNSSTIEKVKAKTTDVYTKNFYSGETVYIYVQGDGDTDLDLYIYDENGNLIDSDLDPGDTCLCSFKPKWYGKFTIKVKNRGDVYNKYTIRFVQ